MQRLIQVVRAAAGPALLPLAVFAVAVLARTGAPTRPHLAEGPSATFLVADPEESPAAVPSVSVRDASVSATVHETHSVRPESRPALREPAAKPAPEAATHRSGMVVAIDPETGALVPPTSEQRAALGLDAATIPTRERFPEIHHPDGRVTIRVDRRLRDYSMVTIGPDGRMVFRCAQGDPAHADHDAPPPPNAQEER